MKALLVNTPASANFRGGDTTQMVKTGEALNALGVETAISTDAEPDARGFDVAHVFNLRTIDVTAKQVLSLKRSGVPVVMSPIYLNPAYPLWATQVITNIFSQPRSDAEIAKLLDGLRDHTLRIKKQGGGELGEVGPDTPNRGAPNYDARQRAILANIAHLLPNSYVEMNSLVKTLRVRPPPFTVVPYAADPTVFLDPDPEPSIQKHGLKDFILQVGRIELSKNQLLLAYALRELDLPLVLIGGSLQAGYLELVKRFGPKRLTIIPHLAPEELRGAYAAARVHVLPSWIETCGLTTMEAALANCSVVVSIAGCELEYYRDFAYYCNPADVASIRTAVLLAYENYDRDAERRRRLKELILKEYTWARAGELTKGAYDSVIGDQHSRPN
jgi:glycosyltransferase involved in cell wall biosynthesis